MDNIIYIFLFVIGTIFGSFASVIIYRLKKKEKGILLGRSHCPKCLNILKAIDLIPIFSWLFNKGKCRYCKKKVSSIYPLLELSTGILFALIGYFLIDINLIIGMDKLELTKLFFWLFVGFITIVYSFYDILFLEINDFIMILAIVGVLIILSLQTLFPSFYIINTISIASIDIQIGIFSIILALIIIGGLYLIIFREFHEIIDILILLFLILIIYLFKIFFNIQINQIPILNAIVGSLAIFIFFFLQIVISKGKWLGGGDLRIAIFIGLMLGISYSFAGIMLSYLSGSIIGLSLILVEKIKKGKKAKLNSIIPFGPFLAIGFFITILAQSKIINLINIYF